MSCAVLILNEKADFNFFFVVNTGDKLKEYSRTKMDLNKSSSSIRKESPVESRKTPTVDELLKMLTEKKVIGNNKPPPIPPKPRTGLESPRGLQKGFMRYINDNHSDRATKPFVTESPEEANNNDLLNRNKTNNTSTVEILEVPYKGRSTYGNPTFNRSQQKQQLFYENNSYAAPVITSATDNEDGDQSEDDVALPTEIEIESMLNDSVNEQPQRSSTPNSVQRRLSGRSTIQINAKDSNASRITNISSQDKYFLEDDPLNISRESDELTNTSALNQSGGGELVGLYDNLETANNSKESPRANVAHGRMPYTVQLPSQTPTYTPNTSQRHANTADDNSSLHDDCKQKIFSLEKLTSSLTEQVEKLDNQVISLTSKLEQLEKRLASQDDALRQIDDLNHQQSLNSSRQQYKSDATPASVSQHVFSQSTSTINKLGSTNAKQNVAFNPTSTYSRNHVATISRNSNPPARISTSSGLVSSSAINKSACKHSVTQPCTSTITKPLKRNNNYSSASSLYVDKSGSTSISPTPNYQSNRQSVSPTSLMNLTAKRDPLWHTSMISLTNLSQHSGSTLKKSSVAGSVSNLSHVGGQISNWPSFGDFVPAKHRAKDILFSEEERLIKMVLYNIPIIMRLPNWVDDSYNIDKIVEPPAVQLKLDWVHGYRGRDCRSNITYLPTGECVYFVASIIVLYNPEDKVQRHYLGHTDSVKCIALHPNRLIIASGQSTTENKPDKRPVVRVWNTVSLVTMKVIWFNEDFDRPICCLAFSKQDNGDTLAVVDESNEHTITLLDWQRDRNWRLAETNSGHEQVLAIDYHPIEKHILVAVGKGSINFWDTRGMTLTKKAGLFDKYDKPKYVLCLTFNNYGDTITGDSNGNLMIWPKGNNRPKRVIHDAHQGGVFSVLAMKDGSYLSGGRDRRIVEWDEEFNQTGREAELPEHCGGVRYITYAKGSQVFVGTLRNSILLGSLDTNFVHIVQGHSEATSSLAIHPNQSRYLSGGFDDQLLMFDSTTHEVIWSKCIMMPATAAAFSPNGFLLVVGSTLGKWLVIDAITQEILFTKCDGSGTINVIKISPNGEFFCLGSSDSQVYIYQTTEAGNKFCRIGTCVGHTGPVKEIDWDLDGRYIQTQSINFELLFWKALNCRPLDDEDIIDDLMWSTHNCTIGFNVIGIWSDSIDSSLINQCDKSNNDDLVATVTDSGNINIFKWPAYFNQCLSQKYNGNVDKFNFIKFSADDSRLIAVGTKTCVTTEWILDKDNAADTS